MAEDLQPIAEARRDQMFPRLNEAEIDRLRRFGNLRAYSTGECVLEAGRATQGLYITLSSEVRRRIRRQFMRFREIWRLRLRTIVGKR